MEKIGRTEIGRVKFFDSRENKRFGFFRTAPGEEIFFHFNDGQTFEVSTYLETKVEWKDGRLRDPRRGDEIVFERAEGSKGPKACPWGFAEDYRKAMEVVGAEQVVVKVTSVTCNGTTYPSSHRFIALRGQDGRLLQKDPDIFCGINYYKVRDLKDELVDLPIVEAAVVKSGWFSSEEKLMWTEPDLTRGVAPQLLQFLEKIDSLTATRRRISGGTGSYFVRLEAEGLEPYEVEVHEGFGAIYLDGGPSLRSPSLMVQRTAGRTYVLRYGPYNDEALKQIDGRLVRLDEICRTARWAVGPYEERMLRETGGRYFAYSGSSEGFKLYCPHGWVVSKHGEGFPSYAGDYPLLPTPLFEWVEACPFGCLKQGRVYTQLVNFRNLSRKYAELGISEGLQPYESIGIGPEILAAFQKVWGRYGYHSCIAKLDDGRFLARSNKRIAIDPDEEKARERAWHSDDFSAEELGINQALKRLGLLR